jgi:iron-sulfur cluster repair protein YtfE (RIC family)
MRTIPAFAGMTADSSMPFIPILEFSMNDIARYLTDDHRHCDDLFADAEAAAARGDADEARRLFDAFHAATLAHFAREEQVLFPAFEAATGMRHGPTEVMREEHERMTDLFEQMGQALTGGDLSDYLGGSETMLVLMQQHNLKEEQMLYPMCDRALGARAAGLLDAMRGAHAGASA